MADTFPQIILHRAGGFLAPENTLGAMEVGLSLPVDGLEIDVMFTKDEVPIIYHDNTLHRTTKKRRMVKRMPYRKMKELDNGSWFDKEYADETIPTLRQFLTQFRNRRMLYIEIKQYKNNLMAIPKLIEEFDMIDNIVLLSFHFQALTTIKEKYPTIQTMFLLGSRWRKDIEYYMDDKIDSYGLSYRLADRNPELVTTLLKRGFPINIWSCNDMVVAQKMIDLGVTSITTDVPNKLLQLQKNNLQK